jgi:hypothetical protein
MCFIQLRAEPEAGYRREKSNLKTLSKREEKLMRAMKFTSCICLAVLGLALSAQAQSAASGCKQAAGRIVWTVIPVPEGDHPRVVGSVTGTLKGSSSASILAFNPPSIPGVLTTHDQDIFVTGPQDILIGDAFATFTFTSKPGEVLDSQTINIVGGTGRFSGASGSLEISGKGYNFPPNPGGPVTFFNVEYKGQICGLKPEGLDD